MKKISEWLAIFLIFDIERNTKEQQLAITVDRNLWIGSLMHLNVNPANVQVVIVTVSQKKHGASNEIKNTIYEKNPFQPGDSSRPKLKKLTNHNLKHQAILLETEATKNLFKYIDSLYEVNHRMVVTLGHGGVFGMNYVDDYFTKSIKNAIELKGVDPKKELTEIIDEYDFMTSSNMKQKKLLKDFKGINDQPLYSKLFKNYKIKDELSTREFAESFTGFTDIDGKKPVDILVIGNCFMQNIFAQYDLYKMVDYYVAPISGISYPGYNFIDILKRLENKTYNSVKEVAEAFADKTKLLNHRVYLNRGKHASFAKTAMDERWFVQCIKLDNEVYNKFGELFSLFTQDLASIGANNTSFLTLVKEAYEMCYSYSNKTMPTLMFIDFFVFCEALRQCILNKIHLLKPTNFDQILSVISQILQLKTQFAISSYVGKDFYSEIKKEIDFGCGVDSIGFGFLFLKDVSSKSSIPKILDPSYTNQKQPVLNSGTRYLEFLQSMVDVFKF